MKSEDYPQTEFVARLVPTAARSNAKPPEVVNPAVRTNPELARRIHHGETRWHLPGPCGVRVRRCCCRLLSPLFLLLRPSPSGASTPRTLPSLSLSLLLSLLFIAWLQLFLNVRDDAISMLATPFIPVAARNTKQNRPHGCSKTEEATSERDRCGSERLGSNSSLL